MYSAFNTVCGRFVLGGYLSSKTTHKKTKEMIYPHGAQKQSASAHELLPSISLQRNNILQTEVTVYTPDRSIYPASWIHVMSKIMFEF